MNINEEKIIFFNKLPIEEELGKPLKDVFWGRTSKKYSTTHSISYYLAMFSPSLPSYFIDKYTNPGDLIMDNFSGRGTTALVAREKNRKFIGNDLNPYAFVLSKFKISTLRKSLLIKKIHDLEKEFISKFQISEDAYVDNKEEVSIFYSKKTFKQLIFLREKIGKKWKKLGKYENAILAFALGLMHGPSKKDGSTIYFSLKMPNTISMSPNYVKKYAIKNKLTKPDVNIFKNLEERIESKFSKIFEEKYEGKIFLKDSTILNEKINNESVDLIITSPPYLNIVNYTNSNWLKLWLLGFERKSLRSKIKLSDNLKMKDYSNFLFSYLNAIETKLKKGAKICLVVGDVMESKLIENVWTNIEEKIFNLKFKGIYYDYKYKQNKKSTNLLNSRSGKATKIEKILVLEKI